MQTCEQCGKTGDIGLREASVKEEGKKWICQDCWTKLFDKNQMVSGDSCGGGGCGVSCPGCRNA